MSSQEEPNAMYAPMATQFSPAPLAGAIPGGHQTFGTQNAYQLSAMVDTAAASTSTGLPGFIDEWFDFDAAAKGTDPKAATERAAMTDKVR